MVSDNVVDVLLLNVAVRKETLLVADCEGDGDNVRDTDFDVEREKDNVHDEL